MSLGALLLIFALCIVPSSAGYICRSRRTDGNCLLMVNVLRDPHQMSNWNARSWHKAIHQLQAYQQLFQEDDGLRRKRSAAPPPSFLL